MEEFLEAALVLPRALASRCRWHGAAQQEEGARSERPAKATGAKATGAAAGHSLPLWPAPRWSAALLRRGPVCHLFIGPDLISAEQKSQFWSKRTPANKAVL